MPTNRLISSVTVGSSGAANIEFTSIPQGFTDLKIYLSVRSDAATVTSGATLVFNNDTGFNYTRIYFDGTGTTASGTSNVSNSSIASINIPGANGTASTFGSTDIYIPNYASTSNYKSAVIDSVNETNATTARLRGMHGMWLSNNAITTITISPTTGTNFIQHSTAYLYGISNA